MEIMPTIDIPQLSMALSQNRIMQDLGVAMLDMSLENAQEQGGAIADFMRGAMENSVNPAVGGNFDMSV